MIDELTMPGTRRISGEAGESSSGTAEAGGWLHFVVHKHQARHLHYDFRLELDGMLKSWAMPKGPARTRGGKRLAIMVEDHPLDYGVFEGVLPAGTYGAGTVMVWDSGTYRVPGAVDRADDERKVAEGLAQGDLHIVLEGERLRGAFQLIKLKRGGDADWLLITGREAPSTGVPATAQDRSVLSDRTMEQITAQG